MKTIKLNHSDGKIYFLSDLHLGHENVLNLNAQTRPFSCAEEMNEFILAELSKKIQPEDTVFDLGDLFWKADNALMNKTINALGTKKLYKVLGNHDKEDMFVDGCLKGRFLMVRDRLGLWVTEGDKKYNFILDHFPLEDWDRKFHDSWMIHGHCHGHMDARNLSGPDLGHKRFDVGFDGDLAHEIGTFIVEFNDIIEYARAKNN